MVVALQGHPPIPICYQDEFLASHTMSHLVTNPFFAVEWWFNKIDKQIDDTDRRFAHNKLRTSNHAAPTNTLHLFTPELLNGHRSIEGLVVFRRRAPYPNQPWSNRRQI